MSLILCKMEFDVVLDCEGKTIAELGILAKRLGEDEARRAHMTTATLIRSIDELPKDWEGSIPYREDLKDETTCAQVLAKMSDSEERRP